MTAAHAAVSRRSAIPAEATAAVSGVVPAATSAALIPAAATTGAATGVAATATTSGSRSGGTASRRAAAAAAAAATTTAAIEYLFTHVGREIARASWTLLWAISGGCTCRGGVGGVLRRTAAWCSTDCELGGSVGEICDVSCGVSGRHDCAYCF
jgi:hypothetical protein